MTTGWSSEELERIGSADELQIAMGRADGTLRRWVPIWVVCLEDQVYVRTWYRRETGWFGHALDSGRARIRVPGLEVDVAFEDVAFEDVAVENAAVENVGDNKSDLRAGVDAAYRTKYGRHGGTSVGGMTTDDAAATTLRLTPEKAARAGEGD